MMTSHQRDQHRHLQIKSSATSSNQRLIQTSDGGKEIVLRDNSPKQKTEPSSPKIVNIATVDDELLQFKAVKNPNENLRKQVQRNLQVMNVLRLQGMSSGGNCALVNGPVLKCQKKQIAPLNKEKALVDKMNFYKNKETRWACNPCLIPSEIISQALQSKGISPEDMQIFQHLTEATMALAYPKQHQIEEIRKHTSLPLTQAYMSQRLGRQPLSPDTADASKPFKQVVYSKTKIQRSPQSKQVSQGFNGSITERRQHLQRSIANNNNSNMQDTPPRNQSPLHNPPFAIQNSIEQLEQAPVGFYTQRSPAKKQALNFSATDVNQYVSANSNMLLKNHEFGKGRDTHIFSQYLDSINNSSKLGLSGEKQNNPFTPSAKHRSPISCQESSPNVRIPLKTAMIKYREKRTNQESSLNKKKLHDALRPFSNPAPEMVTSQGSFGKRTVSNSPDKSPVEITPRVAAASKVTAATTQVSAHGKPFFDPSLTYVPPIQRGVVATTGQTPRDRLRELFRHYQHRKDYQITSQFLRRRDWLDIPSRLKQIQVEMTQRVSPSDFEETGYRKEDNNRGSSSINKRCYQLNTERRGAMRIGMLKRLSGMRGSGTLSKRESQRVSELYY